MRQLRRWSIRLGQDRRGATMVEFALVILPFLVILLGLFDFAYRAYLTAVVEGTLQSAARQATTGGKTSDQIDSYVREQIENFQKNATVSIVKKSYSEFSGVGKPEKYTDSNGNNKYDAGVDCYYDDNGNRRWDAAATSGRTGLGGADDLVYYTVTTTFDRIVPLTGFLGFSPVETVTATMVLRNQPYGTQAFVECLK